MRDVEKSQTRKPARAFLDTWDHGRGFASLMRKEMRFTGEAFALSLAFIPSPSSVNDSRFDMFRWPAIVSRPSLRFLEALKWA